VLAFFLKLLQNAQALSKEIVSRAVYCISDMIAHSNSKIQVREIV